MVWLNIWHQEGKSAGTRTGMMKIRQLLFTSASYLIDGLRESIGQTRTDQYDSKHDAERNNPDILTQLHILDLLIDMFTFEKEPKHFALLQQFHFKN